MSISRSSVRKWGIRYPCLGHVRGLREHVCLNSECWAGRPLSANTARRSMAAREPLDKVGVTGERQLDVPCRSLNHWDSHCESIYEFGGGIWSGRQAWTVCRRQSNGLAKDAHEHEDRRTVLTRWVVHLKGVRPEWNKPVTFRTDEGTHAYSVGRRIDEKIHEGIIDHMLRRLESLSSTWGIRKFRGKTSSDVQSSSPKNDARLVMMTMVVLAVFVGHERYGGRGWTRNGRQRDLEELTRRCFREFWKERGTRVRVLVLREELTANIRMSQDAEGQSKGSRMVDKGRSKRRFKCECHKCREASAFEANKRGLAERRDTST